MTQFPDLTAAKREAQRLGIPYDEFIDILIDAGIVKEKYERDLDKVEQVLADPKPVTWRLRNLSV